VAELGERARRALGEPEAALGATYELRYRGQAFELAIRGSTTPALGELREAFEREHDDRYGYRDAEQKLELVTIRVSATVPGAELELTAAGAPPIQRGRRAATLAGAELELEVVRGAPSPGTEIAGPAVVELAEATLLVPPLWSGSVDEAGTIMLERPR